MPNSHLHLIAPPLTVATRAATPRFAKTPLAKNLTPAQAAGHAYERKVIRALSRLDDYTIQPNPWFAFCDRNGPGLCSPDAIMFLNEELRPPRPDILLIEIKRTWVPVAAIKLRKLYSPVIRNALGLGIRQVFSVIICKNLTPNIPSNTLIDKLSEAFVARQNVPTLMWLGSGEIPW